MAFLSTIMPGSTAVAKINVKAHSETIPKAYGMDTVLKYETPEGDIKYSDILQATVEVKDAGLFQKLFGWIYKNINRATINNPFCISLKEHCSDTNYILLCCVL